MYAKDYTFLTQIRKIYLINYCPFFVIFQRIFSLLGINEANSKLLPVLVNLFSIVSTVGANSFLL